MSGDKTVGEMWRDYQIMRRDLAKSQAQLANLRTVDETFGGKIRELEKEAHDQFVLTCNAEVRIAALEREIRMLKEGGASASALAEMTSVRQALLAAETRILEQERQINELTEAKKRKKVKVDHQMPSMAQHSLLPKVPRLTRTVLQFAKLTENAFAPTKGSKLAAGYDLYSAYDYVIPSRGGKIVAKTDLQIRVPAGTYGRVAPRRSGLLAAKNHIDIGAGVVDEDYTGNVGVVMFNHAAEDFEVKKGDRIAQLVCEMIAYSELQECKSLEETERGQEGFGNMLN